MTRKKPKGPKPLPPGWGATLTTADAPGPVTNRRLANKPLKPLRGPRFLERVDVGDGPEDVSGVDS